MLRGLAMPVQVGGEPPKKTKWGQWALAGGLFGLIMTSAAIVAFQPEPQTTPPALPVDEAQRIVDDLYNQSQREGAWNWGYMGNEGSPTSIRVRLSVDDRTLDRFKVTREPTPGMCNLDAMRAIAPYKIQVSAESPSGVVIMRCDDVPGA